jgi:hypothetical protein
MGALWSGLTPSEKHLNCGASCVAQATMPARSRFGVAWGSYMCSG